MYILGNELYANPTTLLLNIMFYFLFSLIPVKSLSTKDKGGGKSNSSKNEKPEENKESTFQENKESTSQEDNSSGNNSGNQGPTNVHIYVEPGSQESQGGLGSGTSGAVGYAVGQNRAAKGRASEAEMQTSVQNADSGRRQERQVHKDPNSTPAQQQSATDDLAAATQHVANAEEQGSTFLDTPIVGPTLDDEDFHDVSPTEPGGPGFSSP